MVEGCLDILVKESSDQDTDLSKKLVHVRENSFDKTYLDKFPSSHYIFLYEEIIYAKLDDKVVGYLKILEPNDLMTSPVSQDIMCLLNLREEKFIRSGKKPYPGIDSRRIQALEHEIEYFRGEFNYNLHTDHYIEEIAVLPEFRNRGIGKSLFSAMTDRICDGSNIYLYARTDGPSPSRPIFERWGFRPIVKLLDYLSDGTNLTLMQLSCA